MTKLYPVALLVVVSGCSSTLSQIPKSSYRALNFDHSPAVVAGPAGHLVDVPQLRHAVDQLITSDNVIELEAPEAVLDAHIGILPVGSHLGFNSRGKLQWVTLAAPAPVFGRLLPGKSIALLENEKLKSVVLGGPAEIGPRVFATGDELVEWPEGQKYPSAVILNGPRIFGEKKFAGGARVELDGSGEIVAP